MRYLRAGTGPGLVLVHGLLGYSFSWRFAIPALAQHFTVYAVDMLGTGFSDRPSGLDCSFRAGAQRLLQFLDLVGVSKFDLLGTSQGGAVAMAAAACAPDRVQRLVLVAPVNPWSAHGRRIAPFLSNRWISRLFLWSVPLLEPGHNLVLRRLYADPSRIRPGTLEGYSAPFSKPGSFEYALSVLSCWSQSLGQLEAALPTISHIPTLVMWGDRDVAVDPASAVPLCRNFSEHQLITMRGVGHLPYEEAPEEFNRTVTEFLLRHP